MKFAPVVFLLAFALCTSCATSPPAGAPAVPAVPAAAAARARELGAECQRALEAGDYAGARATAAEALHLDPQYEEAWVAFGMASVRLGQPDKARESYERALALHRSSAGRTRPDASQAYYEVFLLSLLSRYGEAEALLKRARADFPTDQQLSTLADLFPEFVQNWGHWTVKSP